jgi:glycosyltransferase involved in cell wall biosynthesis
VRLLLITPKVDPSDDLFGHVATWAAALAARVDRLYVVALWEGTPSLPDNARFAGLGKGRLESRTIWLTRLQRYLVRLCLGRRVDAILAHMAPVFAVAAAPIARLSQTPLFLWYAHGHVSPMLRLAHLLVDGVGTSTPEGFRIPSRKVTITGQGIDTAAFRPGPPPTGAGERMLSVGRFSPIKDYETLLEAAARLKAEPRYSTDAVRLTLIGGTHSAEEAAYLDRLRDRARRLGLAEQMRFEVGIPHREMPSRYLRASLFATASRTGSLDKSALEAAACQVVPIVCNVAFRGFLGDRWSDLSFRPGDVDQLAERLTAWLAYDPGERHAVGAELRRRVERDHSVDYWADAVVAMIRQRLDRE